MHTGCTHTPLLLWILGLASFTVKHRQLSTLFRTPSQPLSPLIKVSDDEYRLLWLFTCPQTLSIAHTRAHTLTLHISCTRLSAILYPRISMAGCQCLVTAAPEPPMSCAGRGPIKPSPEFLA